MNTPSIKDKVVLITGGTRGIGHGIAKHLATQGCKTVLTGRKPRDVEEAVAELNDTRNGSASGIAADVRLPADMDKAVEHTLERFGQLDVLVANAGLGRFGSIEDLSHEDWKQVMDTNLTGVFNSVKSALEAIKASKGYIITISSLAGTNFFAGGSAYNASKFGVTGFTQSVMLDLRPYDVKVSTIMPGSVASHFNQNDPGPKDDWKIQPEDLGETVEFLLRMNPRTLPSKIEVRPSKPPGKQ